MDVKDNIWDFIKVVAQSANTEFKDMDLVDGLIDKQIYWVRQNTEMPDLEPFITLEIGNAITVGKERKQYSPPDGEDPGQSFDIVERNRTYWNANIDINIYCKNAYEVAILMVDSLRESDSLERLRQSKLGIVSVGIVNDISAVVDTVWSGRAHFMIVFSFNQIKEKTVTAIHHAPVKGTEIISGIQIDRVVDREVIVLG